jgi:hypothetical protein
LLALAVLFGLEVEQMDIKTAFLNADVDEEIYLEIPDGVNVSKKMVLKLKKALYGIKQAPKAWNDNIDRFLRSLGFVPCVKDPCIYVKRSKTNRSMMLGLYVDDIMSLYASVDKNEWLQYKQQLMSKYQVSDLGRVNHILSMKVTMTDDKLYIDQQAYVNEKLNSFNMHECKSMNTPESGVKLVEAKDNERLSETETTLLRSIIGSLQYASISTRPDITHAVNTVSRFMQNGGRQHMVAAKRVLHYLQGTQHLGLVYKKDANLKIDSEGQKTVLTVTGYCDSDWGGDPLDRRSTSGYCVFVNGNLVSWKTKKQPTVAQSSTEAELMASVELMNDIQWVRMILGELGFEVRTPMTMYCDNQSAISISENDVKHDRTKHIDIKYYAVHEQIVNKNVQMQYIKTDDQLADIFTKGLGAIAFIRLRDQLMSHR